MDDDTALHIPAQTISAPTSISPQGKAYLDRAAQRLANQPPGTGAIEAISANSDAAVQFMRPMAMRFQGSEETIPLPNGAKLYRMTPDGRSGRLAEVAYFDVHGGGFTAGGGEMCLLLAKIRACDYGAEVYAVDYRLAPEHSFPAPLDDCMAAYREILKRRSASTLVVGGASAGGNLAAATLLRARDEGLELPLALLLQTPAVDMTYSGDTYQTNRFLDVAIGYLGHAGIDSFVGTGDRTNPYLSPLFGDFTKGWPPTLLTSGTRDLLLSDTVRMHRALRRAGIDAQLHVSEASPHGGFMGSAPEDHEIMAECRRFIQQAWGV